MKSEKFKKNTRRGMTYVEIIVVLSIFSIMSGAVIYNYHAFQSKIDTKNLASDIASKIVEAQKSALSGKLPPDGGFDANWKPSYGVYFFRLTTPGGKTRFIYFKDLDQNNRWSNNSETLQVVTLPKNIIINDIKVYPPLPDGLSIGNQPLYVTFSRPSSSASLYSNTTQLLPAEVSYIQIDVQSPDGSSRAAIQVYPSGRVQVN